MIQLFKSLTGTAGKWMNDLESNPIGFFRWIGIFISVVLLRDLLEAFSGEIPFVHFIDFFIHYPLAFLNPILALSLILAIFSGVKIEKVTRLMLYVSAGIFMLPPLLDLALSLSTGKEEGSHIGYLFLERHEYLDHLINFFNPFRSFSGTTPGIRIEAFISCSLAFIYVIIKSGKILRAAGAFLTVYLVSLIFFTYPYNWFHLFGGDVTNAELVRPFFEGNGVVVRHLFDPQSYSFASLHVLLLVFLSAIWMTTWSVSNSAGLLGKVQPGRLLFTIFITGTGAVAALTSLYPEGIPWDKFGLFDWVSCVQIALIVLFSDLLKTAFTWMQKDPQLGWPCDKATSRALVAGTGGITFLLAATLHYSAFTITMTIICTFLLFHLEPFRFRRIALLAAPVEGLGWLLYWLLGFALFTRGEAPALISRQFAFTGLITLSAVSLWESGRRKGGLYGDPGDVPPYSGKIAMLEPLRFVALPVAFLGAPLLYESPVLATAGVIAAATAFFSSGTGISVVRRYFSGLVLVGYLGLIGMTVKGNPGIMATVEPSSGKERLHHTLAHKFLWDGYPEHALVEYESAVASGTKTLEMYTTLAYLYEQRGMPERKINIAEMAVEALPGSAGAWSFLGDNLLKNEMFDGAAAAYDRAWNLPHDEMDEVEFLYRRGITWNSAGRSLEARKSLEKAVLLAPDDPKISSAYWNTVFSCASTVPDGGDEIFWRKTALNSESTDSLYLAAAYFNQAGIIDLASNTLARIGRLSPEEIPALYLEANIHAQKKDLDLAIEYMSRVVDGVGGFSQPAIDLSLFFKLNGDLNGAVEALKRYIHSVNGEIARSGIVYMSLASLLVEIGNDSDAALYLVKAFEDPELGPALRNRGGIEFARIIGNREKPAIIKEYSGSLSDICNNSFLAAAAGDTVFTDALARELTGRELVGEALCAYYNLLNVYPGYIPAYFNSGLILQKMGKFMEASVMFERVCEAEPENIAGWFQKANCLIQAGELEEGIRVAKLCLIIDPGFEPALLLLDEYTRD